MGIFALYRTYTSEGKKVVLKTQAILTFLMGLIPLYFLLTAPTYEGDPEYLSDHWVTVNSVPYKYKEAYARGVVLKVDGREGRQGKVSLFLMNDFVRPRPCLYDVRRPCIEPAEGREGVLAKGNRFIVRLDTSQSERGLVVGAFTGDGWAIFDEDELLAWLDRYRVNLWLLLTYFWGWALVSWLILLYRRKYGWKEDAKEQKRA